MMINIVHFNDSSYCTHILFCNILCFPEGDYLFNLKICFVLGNIN